jgi:hypothetical protein
MSRCTTILGLISALNLIALAVTLSLPSRAAVAGMDYRALTNDPDFTRAVQSIVQNCKVNLDTDKLKCQRAGAFVVRPAHSKV